MDRLEELMDVGQVANVLGASPRTVWNLVHNGELDSVLIGRLRRFEPQAVERFIVEHASSARGASR